MKSQSFVRHNRLKIILSKLADIFLDLVRIRIEIVDDGHLRPVELFLAKVCGEFNSCFSGVDDTKA